MSKRFGRNQKRRMRIQLAEADATAIRYQQAYEMSDALLKKTSISLADAMDVVNDASRILGNRSAALPPESMNLSGRKREFIDLPVLGDLPVLPFDGEPHSNAVSVDRLRVLLARVDPDRYTRATHVRVNFGDGTWGYAMSDMAVTSVPKDILVKRISQELALAIGANLKGEA